MLKEIGLLLLNFFVYYWCFSVIKKNHLKSESYLLIKILEIFNANLQFLFLILSFTFKINLKCQKFPLNFQKAVPKYFLIV